MISQMPFDQIIVSTIEEKTSEKILKRSMSMAKISSVDPEIVDTLLEEIRYEYDLYFVHIIEWI